MDEIAVAWVRRRITQGPSALWPGGAERLARLRTLWDATFPNCSYLDFRLFLASVAAANSALSRVDNWQTTAAEWIAPIDDDDWHLPGLAAALAAVPGDFVMACWPVKIANLTRTANGPSLYLETLTVARGPLSCGYAIRKRWLETLSPRQLALLRDDHHNVHRYVDFSGEKYLFLDQPFAQYVWTPASISSISSSDATELNIATREEYVAFALHCPPGVREVAEFLSTI